MEKTKKSKALTVVLVVALAVILAAVAAMVYLVGAGYADEAIRTVARWGEDGTLDNVAMYIQEKLPPILIAAGTTVGMVLSTVIPVMKKVRTASEQLDKGTSVSVKTAELAESAREEMREHSKAMDARLEAFMGEAQAREDARAEEQRAVLEGFINKLSADVAAEHDKTRRIEGGVGKLVRMEMLAHGADENLVKKGVANEIACIAGMTDENSADGEDDAEEGGDADEENNRADGEAIENQAPHA